MMSPYINANDVFCYGTGWRGRGCYWSRRPGTTKSYRAEAGPSSEAGIDSV